MLIGKETGIKKGCIGKSKSGLSTKIHTACDAVGNLTGFHLTPEQAPRNLEGTDILLPELVSDIGSILVDKAYDTDERVSTLIKRNGC